MLRQPLVALQASFLADLTGRAPRRPLERAALFRKPPRGSVEQRWEIYSSGYVTRIAEALENDYPATARILGSGAFRSLTQRYVVTHPPRSFDLGRAGDRLPSFLQNDPLGRKLPFLPDLAMLEWAIAEAFIARDAEPLRWADLQAMEAAAILDLPIELTPGTTWIDSAWPLKEIWECRNRPDSEIDLQVEGRSSTVLVFRHGFEVRCRTITKLEARLLVSLKRVGTMGGVIELEDCSPRQVKPMTTRFRRFVESGLLIHSGAPAQPAAP